MSSNLGRQAARGAAWSLGARGVTVLIQFLSISILSRMVAPEAFGLVAMVTALVGLGELVRDFGLTNAVIQVETLSEPESNNLFWVNTLVGAILGAALFAVATPVANWYDEPDLVRIVHVVSISFLLNGMATQPQALLIRNMRLRAVAIIDVLGVVTALIVAVFVAWSGYGVWALVINTVGKNVMILIASLITTRFVPRWPRRDVSVMHFLTFGVSQLATRVLVYISTNTDNVLIGRQLGAQQLGLYSRSYTLAYMPSSQIAAPLARVALPMLSRLNKDQKTYDAFLLRSQTILATVATAGYAVVIVFADIVIRVVLGPNWGDAVGIFRILCIVGLIDSAQNVTYWVFVSKGIPAQHLIYSLISRPILILGIILAVPHGVYAVGWTYVAWMICAWPAAVYWASRYVEIPRRAMLVRAARTLVVGGGIAAVGLLMRSLLASQGLIVQIVGAGAVMALVLGAMYLLSADVRKDIRQTIGAVALLRGAPTA